MIKRRDYMDNHERIEQMMKYLMQSKNYRARIYKLYLYVILALFIATSVCLSLYEYLLLILAMVGIIIAICFAISLIKKKKEDTKERKLIECNVNREEMIIIPSGTRFPSMGKYIIVAYYVQDVNTYRFHCKVEDDQSDLYTIFLKLREVGEFPKLKVLVNPNNYKDYKALGYEFIEDTVRLNKELVGKELEKYYGEPWNY